MLALSLFPGLGLLDIAFEEEGICVVRGPDLLWGREIAGFHPPAGKFDGIIAGTPCQAHSALANVVRAVHGDESVAEDLTPEFERVVDEARPAWFLMENVERAPLPNVPGYSIASELVNNRWCGGAQNRLRRFTLGTKDGRRLRIKTEALEPAEFKPAVTTNSGGRRKVLKIDANGRSRGKQGLADHHRLHRLPLAEMAHDQGMPPAFLDLLTKHGAFTKTALRIGIGNGVPLPLARAVARAVREAVA